MIVQYNKRIEYRQRFQEFNEEDANRFSEASFIVVEHDVQQKNDAL